tara:strand:+ start:3396 stop:3827 length:432 start_codon:yes stop_codon:yes gene_type:complete
MIREHVEKAMKKALKTFAYNADVDANKIAFFIHTKPSEEDPTLTPKYFYSVNGQTVTENGKLKNLRFTQDILGKKFDLIGIEAMASQFLANYFKNVSEKEDADARSLYIFITASDEEAKELKLALYKGSEVLKDLDLKEVFGE